MILNNCFSNKYEEYFAKKIHLLEQAYFLETEIPGITVRNYVDRAFEDEEIVAKRLNKGIIDEVVVAWKAGRIKNGIIEMLDGNYLDGYGRQIDKIKMDTYLEIVSNVCSECEWYPENFSKIYEKVINAAPIPNFFGVVYIINLIYFMSRQKLPIYDKYAHKALKSLFMGKKPSEVYVGSAPDDKMKIEEVTAMYMEYIWLLEKTIGVYSIDRKIDRALWTYGHADSSWNL